MNIPPNAPPMQFPPFYPDSVVRSTPYTDAVTASGPKLWWRFNDANGSGTIVDTMGFKNGTDIDPATTLYQQTGLITETNQFSQGAANSATAGITALGIPVGLPTTGFTLEFWMAMQPVQGNQNTFLLQTNIGDQLIIGCTAGTGAGIVQTGSGFTNLPVGTFQATGAYYALTYDGSRIRFYKNGVLVATSTAGALPGSSRFTDFGFGSVIVGNYGGFLDELAMYDHVLTAPQLLVHYNAGIAAITTTTTRGNENQTGVGGAATPPNAPPLTPQAPIETRAINWTPATPPTPPANRQDGYTTTDQINTLFKIVSPRPGSGS